MSATTEVLHATIRATDESSSTLADIAANVRKLEADTRGLRRETHRTAEATRELAKTASGFGELNSQVKELTKGLGEWRKTGNEFFPMFGKALAGVGSVAGLFEITHSVAEAVGQSAALAKQLQISTAEVKGLKLAAAELDVPFETVTKGVGVLSRVLSKTEIGKNKQAAHILQLMGISLQKANGEYKTAAELLPDIADSISRTKNAATQAAVMIALFGKSGLAMLPFLEAGKEELEKFQTLAKKFATNLSGEQIQALERYKNSWIELDQATGMLKTTIGAELAPVLAPIVDQFSDWTKQFAQNEAKTHRLRGAVKDLADGLKKIPWADIVADIEGFAKSINDLVQNTVGWKTVIEGAIVLLTGKFLLALASPIGNIGKLGLELGKLASSWGGVETAAIKAGEATAAAAAKSIIPAAGDAAASGVGAAVGGAAASGIARGAGGAAAAGAASAVGGVGLGAAAGALGESLLFGLQIPAVLYGIWEALQKAKELPDFAGDLKKRTTRGEELPDFLEEMKKRIWRALTETGADASTPAGTTAVPTRRPNLLINPLRDPGVTPWGEYLKAAPLVPIAQSPWTYDPAQHQLGPPQPPAPPVRGQVDVNVKIENLPPGSTVSTTSSGDAQMNTTDVGYNNPSGRGW